MPIGPALSITASGHGSRQMRAVDRFGFPRTRSKGAKTVNGFKSGDLIKARVPTGSYYRFMKGSRR